MSNPNEKYYFKDPQVDRERAFNKLICLMWKLELIQKFWYQNVDRQRYVIRTMGWRV